jgi:hypothetical protein
VAKPHLCPVCLGRGHVPAGFYTFGAFSGSLEPEKCRTCGGSGTLWDFGIPDSGPGYGYVGPIKPQDINKGTGNPPPDVPPTIIGDPECNTQSRP